MNQAAKILLIILLVLLILTAVWGWWAYSLSRNVYEVDIPITAAPTDCGEGLRIAVIGDFGDDTKGEEDVAEMVHGWQVDYVVTVGDNNYPDGKARTIDKNVGQYYHDYIYPYQGTYGTGASENHFFPTLGNHDWKTGNIDAYLDYFTLPGNKRYYDVDWGAVHLFVLDSDEAEPDGRSADSIQAQWLEEQVTASTSPWKLVTLHHVPYSSGKNHGDDVEVQWPYADWGATAVLSGHQHSYEHINQDGIFYFVNGLGGRWRRHTFVGKPRPDSAVRYNQDYGAMRIIATDTCINFSFYNRSEELIDSVTITQP